MASSQDAFDHVGSDAESTVSTESLPSFIEKLDLPSLASLAVKTRQDTSGISLTCRVVTTPKVGSFNVVYPLEFSDGVRWVARIPILEWSPAFEERFRRDIFGMRFIHTETNLPIPIIHAFCSDADNILGRPYVFLSYVDGKQLGKLWFDPEWFTEIRRRNVFRSVAQAMSQLATPQFSQIGQLDLDKSTQIPVVGPIFPSADQIESGKTTGDCQGPYTSVHEYLSDVISHRMSSADRTTALSELALLRIFAATLPDHSLDGPPFVLSFPDFNYQNVYVDDEGNVTGLIDWDGVMVGPRQSGFARYPSWITRDWDPMYYAYSAPSTGDDTDHPVQPSEPSELELGKEAALRAEQQEDSPETLAQFREEYLRIYEEIDPSNALATKNSHILEAIEIAATNEHARPAILEKLAEYLFGPSGASGQELSWWALSKGVSEGEWLKATVGEDKLEAGGVYT